MDRTTAVLVHGGTFSSTMWDAVRAELSIPSVAVDLPGRRHRPADLGLVTTEDWVSAVCDDIASADLSDIALVGHSSAGYVMPGVAARLENSSVSIRALVFVAATVPAEGKRAVDFLRDDLRALATDTFDLVLESARGRTLGGLRPGEPPIETTLEIVENGPRMGLEAPRPLFTIFTWAGFPTAVPRYYVRCLRDRVIPPELADVMVKNMGGATVIDLDAGHGVATSDPVGLAAVIERCVAAG